MQALGWVFCRTDTCPNLTPVLLNHKGHAFYWTLGNTLYQYRVNIRSSGIFKKHNWRIGTCADSKYVHYYKAAPESVVLFREPKCALSKDGVGPSKTSQSCLNLISLMNLHNACLKWLSTDHAQSSISPRRPSERRPILLSSSGGITSGPLMWSKLHQRCFAAALRWDPKTNVVRVPASAGNILMCQRCRDTDFVSRWRLRWWRKSQYTFLAPALFYRYGNCPHRANFTPLPTSPTSHEDF